MKTVAGESDQAKTMAVSGGKSEDGKGEGDIRRAAAQRKIEGLARCRFQRAGRDAPPEPLREHGADGLGVGRHAAGTQGEHADALVAQLAAQGEGKPSKKRFEAA